MMQGVIANPSRTAQRFFDKVAITDDCWLWQAHKNVKGYGQFWMGSERGLGLAHRYVYALCVEAIPACLQIDHLCRQPACVNPDHLELVDSRENTMRGQNQAAVYAARTLCDYGHPLDGMDRGKRRCLTCHRERERARYHAHTSDARRDAQA